MSQPLFVDFTQLPGVAEAADALGVDARELGAYIAQLGAQYANAAGDADDEIAQAFHQAFDPTFTAIVNYLPGLEAALNGDSDAALAFLQAMQNSNTAGIQAANSLGSGRH